MMPAETAPHDVLLFAQAGAVLDATCRARAREIRVQRPSGKLWKTDFSEKLSLSEKLSAPTHVARTWEQPELAVWRNPRYTRGGLSLVAAAVKAIALRS